MVDDGKSWYSAWTFHVIKKYIYKGRGLGRGGWQIDPDYWLVDFHVGFMLALFCLFFSSLFFNIVFTSFFFDFGGFWRPKWLPKSIFGEVFGMLFGHPHFGAIF